jgi:hypothetical protein
VFQPKGNSRCHLRRSPRRLFQHRLTETIAISPKGMKPHLFLTKNLVCSSNITNQERREKLEALMKARAEKTAHIQEQPAEQ